MMTQVPSFAFKDYVGAFAKPLAKLINLILSCCRFPMICKIACVYAILKKVMISRITDPLLWKFSKMYENVLYELIFTSVKYTIVPNQHAFTNAFGNFSSVKYSLKKASPIPDLYCIKFRKMHSILHTFRVFFFLFVHSFVVAISTQTVTKLVCKRLFFDISI